MRWLALALVIACKSQENAPAPGSGSQPAPVAAEAPAFGPKVAPPLELADLRLGMTFDQAARIAPKLVTSKNIETTIAGMKASVTFRDDVIDRIELAVPASTAAALEKQWGPQPWFDPTTRWFASYDAADATLKFASYVPDLALLQQGARVLDHALATLADPKLPVPPGLLDMGPKKNPFRLDSQPGRVRVGMPIMSVRAALSSWLELLGQRWGAAKPTSARHWTYQAPPVKVDAQLDDLGDLELVLTPP